MNDLNVKEWLDRQLKADGEHERLRGNALIAYQAYIAALQAHVDYLKGAND